MEPLLKYSVFLGNFYAMQLSRLYFESVLKYTREHDMVSPCYSSYVCLEKWKNSERQSSCKMHSLYRGEKRNNLFHWYFGDVQTCYHSVLYHSNYSTVVQISNFLSNLDYCSSHWHGEELYFNMLILLSSSKPVSLLLHLLLGDFFPTCDGSIFWDRKQLSLLLCSFSRQQLLIP